jgi:hypothetical protein
MEGLGQLRLIEEFRNSGIEELKNYQNTIYPLTP